MITQESLRKEVVQYLNINYSIKIQLPVFQRHSADRISLKLFRSSLGDNLAQNRYLLLIKQSEELLKKNIINTQKIKTFAQLFFESVTNDIQVLQGNEQIRKSFARMRDQITYRVEELASQQRQIQAECKAISQKDEILTFLQSRFKSYLSKVKVVSEHYQAVNNVQVLTSLNLDTIYSQRMAQEEDYVQHYQPLLQVMQRLKSNMIKLYQQLNRCQYFQLPLRSVNFLANCKNLLMELEPFIIRPDCVFNRLIFHVTKGQKDNNQLIGRVFQANIAFANDVVSDIFKAFFMAHIFKDYYRNINKRIETQRQELITHFQHPRTNSENFYSQIAKTQKKMGDVELQIDSLKRVIGMGKDKIMREFLGRNQCKKLNLLINLQEKSKAVLKFSKTMLSVLRFKSRLSYLQQNFDEIQRHCLGTVNAIKQQENQNLKIEKPVTANIKQIDEQIEKRFKESYLKIQEGILQNAQTRQVLKQTSQDNREQYFDKKFFPKIQLKCQQIMNKYVELEIELLNNYQSLRKQKIIKGQEATQKAKELLIQLSDYFEGKLDGQAGYQIRNEDIQCQEVKDNIIKVQQVQFLLNNFIGNKGVFLKQLTRYKTNLQWLLQVFQGSMDEKIFESFMQKLNFQAQDWQQRIKKLKQLLRQINRYLSTLKNIIKICGADIFPKVIKLVKNRVQLYEVIQDMYEEFVTVYENTLVTQKMSPKDYGIKLFDQKNYKYVMTLYQFHNRLRAQMCVLKDLLLPKRTLNYLLDDIYQPFAQVFSNFVVYSEEELLNFMLGLQHGLNFKMSQKEIISLFEQTLAKPYNQSYFQNVHRICQEMIHLNEDNKKVIKLQDEEVVVYNLSDFKRMAADIQEHVVLANAILQGLQAKDMDFSIELKSEVLRKLELKVKGEWETHKEEIQKSLSVSRAQDF